MIYLFLLAKERNVIYVHMHFCKNENIISYMQVNCVYEYSISVKKIKECDAKKKHMGEFFCDKASLSKSKKKDLKLQLGFSECM